MPKAARTAASTGHRNQPRHWLAPGAAGETGPGWRQCRVRLRRARRGGAFAGIIFRPGDRPHETVSAPRHGVDATRSRTARVERLAQGGDLDREVAFLNRQSGPDRIHDVLLRDELTTAFDEDMKDVQRPRPQGHERAVRARQPAMPIEAEALEQKGRAGRVRFHLPSVKRRDPRWPQGL